MNQPTGGNPITNFDAPTEKQGQISLYLSNPQTCLQVDAAADNSIIVASCAARASEEWIPIAYGDGYQYYNYYTGLCLNDKYYDSVPNAAPCTGTSNNPNANEEWTFTS